MPNALEQRTGAVRRFNRFYTRQIGVLRKTYLDCSTRSHMARRRSQPTLAARSVSTPAI
jgi:hypothetical protein